MSADTNLMDGFAAPAARSRFALPRTSLRGVGDDRLVAQIRSGDGPAARTAFEVLYDRHHRGVLAFCRHMLGSREEAEDAVQHTFSSAYRALLRDEREIALRAWLYAIARNRCLSMLGARRDQVALDDVEGALPSTRGLALEVEQRSDLRELLDDMQRLPEDQRAALVLAELEAHSHREIGEILGVPPAKVKALVFQARESLMIRRQARETSCADIREQLSVLRGGALRRRELRRHVDSCEGCRMFEAEVRRQRAGIAMLLPVAPTLALKNTTLASAFAATTSAAAGIGAVSGAGAAAGGLAIATKAMGMKALAVLAVAGGAGGGGYVAVGEITGPDRGRAPAPAVAPAAPRPVAGAPATATSPIVAPAARSGAAGGNAGAAAAGSARAGATTGAERAAERSGGRASAGARGRSEAATAAKADRAAARRRAPAAARSDGSARSRAQRPAVPSRGEAQRSTSTERRAAALRDALLRKRRAEAARQAKEQASAPPPATPPAAISPQTSPQTSPRPLERGSAGSPR